MKRFRYFLISILGAAIEGSSRFNIYEINA